MATTTKTPTAAPGVLLAQALGITAPPGDMPPLLPEHEAMQKLKPLMTSLKQACGYDRSWAPAVHQLVHKILSTVSTHTRPHQKLFCPCCTAQKNRYLFGHYYNTDTLVCKRCSTIFRELVSEGKIAPETNAFHARLVSVMDVNLVGKRKRGERSSRSRKTRRRRSRESGSESSDTAASVSSAAVVAPLSGQSEDPNPRRLKAPRHGSPGPRKVEEEDDSASAGSATSSSTPVHGGLWGDVSSDSDSAADVAQVAAALSSPVLFHDYFDMELSYSLNDMPLFGATPDAVATSSELPPPPNTTATPTTTATIDKTATDATTAPHVAADGSNNTTPTTTAPAGDGSDEDAFEFALATLPKLSLNDAAADDSTSRGGFMTRDQFADIVTVYQCALIPADGGAPIPLDRSMVGVTVPEGEYHLQLSMHAVTTTTCMVTAMVVELPTQLSVDDSPAVPHRIAWAKRETPASSFKDTLHGMEVTGVSEIKAPNPFKVQAHRKVAVVAFVTSPQAANFTTYAEMRRNDVAMLPAGGFFDVVPSEA